MGLWVSVVRSTLLRELFRLGSERSVLEGVVQAHLRNGLRLGSKIKGGEVPNQDQVGVGFRW